MMNENLKLIAKISGKTALKWMLIFIGGNIVTGITFMIALLSNIGLAGGGHGHIIGLFFGLIMGNIAAFILIFGAPLFLMGYFLIANKISIQTAIYLIWDGKMGNYISSKVEAIALKLTEKEGFVKGITDQAMLRARMIHLAKNDKTATKMHRKLIPFIFKKLNLDDINFQDEKISPARIISQKFNTFMSETIQPSLQFFWILAAVQIILLITSLFMR